jgi:flagellar biosynthesis protein FlhF
MLEAANRFLPMSPDRVIFTKLDEAVKLGVLITVARRISLPLSYLTTGQEVPDHIEPGRAERLAELLLDGAASPGPDGVEVVAGMALSGGRLR